MYTHIEVLVPTLCEGTLLFRRSASDRTTRIAASRAFPRGAWERGSQLVALLLAALAIIDCRAAGAAPTPTQLLPNPDFNQGRSAPVGWTLSGGQGRWVNRKVLEVTGDGSDSNQWQCSCRFTPGNLYRFQVRARSVGGGRAGFTGPGFANRDQALGDSWAWYGHVFRVPDGATSDDVRLGQWQVAGTSQFDAVRLVPVVPVHTLVHPRGVAEVHALMGTPPAFVRVQTVLGDGESIHAGRYTFCGDFTHEGSNYHRTLQSATAGFNTNRWCFSGNGQVTYRFGLPGYPFRSGNARLSVSYHQRGGCVAEISRDQKSWRPLLTQNGLGTATANVPADMFPADALYLRLKTSAPNSAFQVNDVEFSGDLAGKPPEGVGRNGIRRSRGQWRRLFAQRDCSRRRERLDPADALPDHHGEPRTGSVAGSPILANRPMEARRRTAEAGAGPIWRTDGRVARGFGPRVAGPVCGPADVDAARPIRRSPDASRGRPQGVDGDRAADAAGLLSRRFWPADRGARGRYGSLVVRSDLEDLRPAARRPRPSRRPRRCPPLATTARRCKWCCGPRSPCDS